MARPPRPERREGSLLLGGPDSWRRIVVYGIIAGVLLAVIAAFLAAVIGGSESDPLDPPETPATPEVRVADYKAFDTFLLRSDAVLDVAQLSVVL